MRRAFLLYRFRSRTVRMALSGVGTALLGCLFVVRPAGAAPVSVGSMLGVPHESDGAGLPREAADMQTPTAGDESRVVPAPRSRVGDGVRPDLLERWRSMSPEEQEIIRDRYRRWKELSPQERERILERSRLWRSLPEEKRIYLRERRDLLRAALPKDRHVVRKFFVRMRSLPPVSRQMVRRKIWEWRSLSSAEREEQMLRWPFYRGLTPGERGSLRWFLFSTPAGRPGAGVRSPP